MTNKTLSLTDTIYNYLLDVTLQEDDLMRQCRAETAKHAHSIMQIAPEQGLLLALLIKLIGAKRVIELGTFTGYSSICMARALPDDGRIICCDVSEEYTAIARKYWQAAQLEQKIDLRLAPALDTMQQLLDQGEQEQFDFMFIDAIKEEYLDYYRLGYELLRPGGAMAVDNVLWDGKVADPAEQDADTVALREFNRFVHQDTRVDSCLIPIGDGLTVIRKR
ncbi:MAG: O-methyltransferase [Gammaproteobacteria bacterium]